MSIRLRSRRGKIGTSWQGTALRESLEGVLGTARSSGGRRLARADRVQWLDVAPRRARAGVLDDDGTIYEPELDVAAFGAADRRIVIEALHGHPELPARLSGGVYPEEVERELGRHEATLLPRSVSELSHDCTCLDWPGPCVHVAALAYVLVEAVDEAPAHLLTLRGLTLREIAAPVASGRGAQALAQAAGEPGAGADPSPGARTGSTAEGGEDRADDAVDAEDGESAEDRDGAEDDGPSASQAERPGFDPAIADPTLLREALGAEAAEALAGFFTSAEESGPAR
jgi:uncharacterized Zn finger protein